ncbi:hypothetical protein TWF718_002094 [Orbilia javanica]|uniref:Uncharacterized protein n=1 Tax=Orbilia javanica TaxID=47235 RepID=A0AAN8MZV5_9PEZI
MQLQLRVLLSHRNLLIYPPYSPGETRSSSAQGGRYAQAEHRWWRTIFKSQISQPNIAVLQEELGLESISIVSNGSKIREGWLKRHAKWLDILAVSCDSFNPETSKKIGRGADGENVARLFQIAIWCRNYGIKFKLNTVVNVHNWDEDMTIQIQELEPFRWKVFQCLIVAGENDDEMRKTDARKFLVTEEQWQTA